MAGRYPRAEWMRREYWKAKGVNPDTESGDPPPHAPGYDLPDAELAGHLAQIKRRVVASSELSDLERIQWLGALKAAGSGKPATSAQGLKRLVELGRTAPASVAGGDPARAQAAPAKTPQQTAAELMRQRLADFKNTPHPRLVSGDAP